LGKKLYELNESLRDDPSAASLVAKHGLPASDLSSLRSGTSKGGDKDLLGLLQTRTAMHGQCLYCNGCWHSEAPPFNKPTAKQQKPPYHKGKNSRFHILGLSLRNRDQPSEKAMSYVASLGCPL